MFPSVHFDRSPLFRALKAASGYGAAVLLCSVLAVLGLYQLTSRLAVEIARGAASDPAYPPREKTPIPATAPVTTAGTEAASTLSAYSADPAPSIGPPTDESAAPWSSAQRRTYRTVCVRLCDGYFFPVSYSTSPEFFDADEAACRASCASPARLYVFKNPGETPSAMKNLDGRPYTALETAFLFRTRYEPNCTCKGQPWETAARERHRVYALRALKARGKAGKQEKAELASLESALAARSRHSEAAYRLAGLGGQKRVRARKVIAGRFKTPRGPLAQLQPARKSAPLAGIMGLGGLTAGYEAPKKSEQSRGASVGEMIHRSLGGF